MITKETLFVSDEVKSALLFVLWHHQGGSSKIGQPIRQMLGIGQHDHLTPEQLEKAKGFAELQRQRERQAVAVPDGWKLVPIEPTQAMCQAGQNKASEWPKFPLRINPIYQAMLTSAPSPELISPHPIVEELTKE
jgi:hypothetical protein